jgi:dienelactone hydrolase
MKTFGALSLLFACFVMNAGAKESQFQSEAIAFKGAGDVSLSGSLMLPKGNGPFPVVVLLGGSERLARNAIYDWANADLLVAHEIAVFSFDSPGTGKSEGNRFERTHKERTEDALAAIIAIQHREGIARDKIGLYGASEGGSIVFRAASLSKGIAFGIAISAPVVPNFKHMEGLTRSLAASTGLKGVELEKLVTFNRLVYELTQAHNTTDFDEVETTVAAWDDPGWSQLISLLQERTVSNQEATREFFITIAQKWEGEEWFRGNKMLREFYKHIAGKLGMNLANLHIDDGEKDSARSHVEFASAVVTKAIGSDSSRDEDPVSFLKQIKCPMLCIYGEEDNDIGASKSADIIRKVFAETKHNDFVVTTLPGADHQLKLTQGKSTYRDKNVDNLILDWVQKQVRKDSTN